jgi:hypothetical protein
MAETNMAEAGYDALKMTIRAATSRGVLRGQIEVLAEVAS